MTSKETKTTSLKRPRVNNEHKTSTKKSSKHKLQVDYKAKYLIEKKRSFEIKREASMYRGMIDSMIRLFPSFDPVKAALWDEGFCIGCMSYRPECECDPHDGEFSSSDIENGNKADDEEENDDELKRGDGGDSDKKEQSKQHLPSSIPSSISSITSSSSSSSSSSNIVPVSAKKQVHPPPPKRSESVMSWVSLYSQQQQQPHVADRPRMR